MPFGDAVTAGKCTCPAYSPLNFVAFGSASYTGKKSDRLLAQEISGRRNVRVHLLTAPTGGTSLCTKCWRRVSVVGTTPAGRPHSWTKRKPAYMNSGR